MAYYCQRISELAEETVEVPVEEWVEQTIEKCAEQPCTFLCLNKLWCWTEVILVKIVVFVFVTVPVWIVRWVCEFVSAPIIGVLVDIQPLLCFGGVSFARRDVFNRSEALLLARLSLEAYKDEADADFAQFNSSLSVVRFIDVSSALPPVDTQLYVLLDPDSHRLIVVFRGSAGLVDWIDNVVGVAPIPYTPVTFGAVNSLYAAAYAAVKPQLERILVEQVTAGQVNGTPIKEIWCTGHSLGGAVSTLAAFEIRHLFTDSLPIHNYTFGAPKVGNVYFAFDYNGRIPNSFRITNEGDPGPEFPGTGGPTKYRHVKNHVYFDSLGNMRIEPCPQPLYQLPNELSKYLPPVADVALSYGDAVLTAIVSAVVNAGDAQSPVDLFPGHDMNTYIDNLENIQ